MTDQPTTSTAARRRAIRIVGNVLAIVGVVFVVVALRRAFTTLPAVPLTMTTFAVVVVGVGGNIVALLLAATAWRALLIGFGEPHGWRACFSIVGRANLAKYVPGNVFHLVGRAGLAASWSTPMPVIVASMTIETLLVVAVAGIFGIPAALARLQALSARLLPSMPAAAVFAGVFVVAVVVVTILAVLLRRRGVGVRASALLVVVVCDITTYLVVGSCLWLLLAIVFPAAALPWWLCVSGFSLAWVLGFVTPGAPGGVGVREAVFLVLAAPSGDADVVAAALAAAVVVGRVQSIVADVLVFVVARALRDDQPLRATSR